MASWKRFFGGRKNGFQLAIFKTASWKYSDCHSERFGFRLSKWRGGGARGGGVRGGVRGGARGGGAQGGRARGGRV